MRIPGTFATQRDRGAAAVEMALIMPIAILLVAGIVEFGRLFEIYSATNRLASQFAYSWSACPDSNGSCGTELGLYTTANAITNVAPQLILANASLSMFEFTVVDLAGTIGAPVLIYSGNYQGQPTDLVNATATAASSFHSTATPGSTQTIVVVITTYQHSLYFFNTLIAPFLAPYPNILIPTYTVTQLKS